MIERPKIGVGVCVVKEGLVLLGKWLNAHGAGQWAFPGGHLEFGETLSQCAIREVLEETGMQITNIRRGPYTEDFFPENNKHYITIITIANWKSGTPTVLEPNKCEQWQWFNLQQLPEPLFPTFTYLQQHIINLENYL